MDTLEIALEPLLHLIQTLPGTVPGFDRWFPPLMRFLLPILALLILAGSIRSLLTVPHLPEVWAYLSLPNGAGVPLTHWENTIGRAAWADVTLDYPTISRQHAALIRDRRDSWTAYDLDSKGGLLINGTPVKGSAPVKYGDVLALAGVETVLLPVTPEEKTARRQHRKREERPVSPWRSLIFLTVFQLLTGLQLTLSEGENATFWLPLTFLALPALMWLYFLTLRLLRRVGFEMETIGFFLSTLSLAVVASSNTPTLPKQLIALGLGLLVFLILGIFLRDLDRTQKLRWLMAAGAIGLLGFTLIFGHEEYGATNWVTIAGMSLQPSELAKICYIFAGAATLDRLFKKRNLTLFIVLTGTCLGILALMSDFGTAAIFFVTFLVIAYLRSGDWATLGLITAGAGGGILVVLSLKPYILNRFASWGHAWEHVSAGAGYQQSRAMAAAASGGLVGVGPGEGWLHVVGAADTDLVFGMLCEEWGLIIALLAVVCIVTLAVFAVRCCKTGRSSFYTIAACAATSLLVFQTCLNVFGCMDLLPMTGVTFPFVSSGGTALISSWGLLAFLKATDTRQNASFAIRLSSRREDASCPLPHYGTAQEQRPEDRDEVNRRIRHPRRRDDQQNDQEVDPYA